MKRIILILTIVNIYGANDSVVLRENIVNIVGNSKNLLELNNNIKNLTLTGDKQLISALHNNGLNIIFSYLQNNFKNEFSPSADPEVLAGLNQELAGADKQELIEQNLDYGYLINASKDSNTQFYNKYLKPLVFLINYFSLNYLKQLLTYNHVNINISMRLPIEFPLNYIDRNFINWLNNNFSNQIPGIDSKDTEGDTFLIWASENGHRDIVELLINAGANINIQDGCGNIALIWASLNRYIEIVKLLINTNANINFQDDRGNTALIWASIRGYIEIVELLIKANADINIQNKNGSTALIFASRYGYTDIVELLINHSANINIQDNHERTALILASKYGHKEAVKLLMQAP